MWHTDGTASACLIILNDATICGTMYLKDTTTPQSLFMISANQAERLGSIKAAKQAVKRAVVGKKLQDARRLWTKLKQAASDEARALKQQEEEHALVPVYSCAGSVWSGSAEI